MAAGSGLLPTLAEFGSHSGSNSVATQKVAIIAGEQATVNRKRNTKLVELVQRIAGELAAGGLQTVPIKGSAFLSYEGSASLRVLTEVDVLAMPKNVKPMHQSFAVRDLNQRCLVTDIARLVGITFRHHGIEFRAMLSRFMGALYEMGVVFRLQLSKSLLKLAPASIC